MGAITDNFPGVVATLLVANSDQLALCSQQSCSQSTIIRYLIELVPWPASALEKLVAALEVAK